MWFPVANGNNRGFMGGRQILERADRFVLLAGQDDGIK
jgi:hypothetical protein